MQIVAGRIQPTPSMAIDEQTARKLSEFRLSKGDVVIGRRGVMGRCALVRAEEHGWLCGTGSMVVRTGPSLDAGFVQRMLSSPPIIAEIENASVGSTMINLNQRTLGNLVVPLPPTRAEQQAIAQALSDADALIESVERLLAKKRQVKQGAMQELLTGKRRLLGFTGRWDLPAIGDLFTFKNGLNKAKKFFGVGTPIVNYMDVYGRRAMVTADVRGRVTVTKDELRAFEVRKGDVFFTRTSETADEIGITSVMLDDSPDTVFSGFVLRARPQDDCLDDQFKKYCFSTESVRVQITSQSTETTRALTSGRSLSRVHINRPPRPEQAAIAAVLSDMDAEIAALEAKLAKARQIKQGMMQELLTGRIRLV
jgi:type I restriction enzyme S subunit